jgi:hypothetical protein
MVDINIIKSYFDAGYECLPCKIDKSPLLKKGWKEKFTLDEFKNAEAIGIKGGSYSDGIICLDFDAHQGQKDAYTNLKHYLEIPEIREIFDRDKLPIEKTQSGGYHLLFKTDVKIGNRKIASRMFEGKPDCFIEIKAQDGYFLCTPSPGYKMVNNDILKVAKLNSVDTATMIDLAMSMNEYYKTNVTEYEGTDRPGDKFNKEVSLNEVENILKSANWSDIGDKKWRRPGKKTGISGSLGYIKGCYIFYCFTQNGYPLEWLKAYSPFQLKTALEFNGDYKACATSLPAPEKITIVSKDKLPESELEKILNNCKIDTNKIIERPPVILSIKQKNGSGFQYRRIFTLGNFSVIIGKAKSKKTFLLSLLISFLLRIKDLTYKFINDLSDEKNLIVWFDTEQGTYDSYNTIKRIEKMSGTKGKIKAFNLRPFSPLERCQIIEYAFKMFGNKIGLCIIDGIADLSTAINDELEATRISTMMLRLTKEYNCHISIVIHQNKNDNFATGHLGSSLMKKAEILISTNKIQGSDSTEVRCDYSRGQDFESFNMKIDFDGIPYVDESENKEISNADFTEPRGNNILLNPEPEMDLTERTDKPF